MRKLVGRLAVGAMLTVPMCGGSSGGRPMVQVFGYVTVDGRHSDKTFTVLVIDEQLGSRQSVQSTVNGWTVVLRQDDTYTAQVTYGAPYGCQSGVLHERAYQYSIAHTVNVMCGG